MWPQYSALHDKDRRIQGSQCPAAPRCGSGLRAFLLSDVDQKQGIAGLRFCGVCVVVLPCEVRLDVTGWEAGLGRANSTCCGNCFTACLASGCTSRLRADVGLKPAFLQHGSETGGAASSPHPTLLWQLRRIACDLLPNSRVFLQEAKPPGIFVLHQIHHPCI